VRGIAPGFEDGPACHRRVIGPV